jgi:hypothetical protein
MKEYILCAAVWFDNGHKYEHQPINIKSGYVVCGQRHHNCFVTVSILRNEDLKNSKYGKCIQGFLTSNNSFVSREEGGEIAFIAGQIKEPTNCLFSEDLY